MEKKNTDEIDLLELFLKALNIFRANFWLILSFFLLGVGLGLVSYYTSKKVFENKLVVSSGILTQSYSTILVNNLNKHLSENNLNAVKSILRISDDAIKQIRIININSVIEADASKENDRFIITAEVYDESILPDLQKGLIFYLENNEFVKVRVDQNKQYLKQVISKLDEEIRDLETLKAKISNGNFFQETKGSVMFDPTTVNSKILELTKEKINLQNAFTLANSVHVIEGFTEFKKPNKPRLMVSMLSGALIGLFFVGIVIAFKSIRKLLRMADAAKQSTS
jgi:hypothetical protein